MSEKLIIEKFGPIKRIELDLAKVFILIGPQSSGKSTIAKLVTIFRSFSFVIGSVSFEEALKNYGILSYLKKDTGIEYKTTDYHFSYKKGSSSIGGTKLKKILKEVINVEGTISNYKIEQLGDSLKEFETLLDNLKKEYIRELSTLDNKKIMSSKLESFETKNSELLGPYKNLLSFTNYSVYIPAERLFLSMIADAIISLVKNEIPLPNILLDFGSSFEKARKNISSYDIDFLGISYKHVNNEDRIYLNKRKHIKLSNASSGIQSLIPLLLVIQNNLQDSSRANTYVIEEPELNLYPQAQYELSKVIANIYEKNNKERQNEIIITTHSPYILTAFNNFLLANKLGNKGNKKQVEKVLPKEVWIAQEDFNAYYIDGKNTEQIFDREAGLIADNHLDDASEVIMEDFDNLMDLYSNTLLNGQTN